MKLLGLLDFLLEDEQFAQALNLGQPGQPAGTVIAPEGLWPVLTAGVSGRRDLTVVVLPSGRQAEEFAQMLEAYTSGVSILPSWETLPHERLSPRVDTMAQRAAIFRRLTHPDATDPYGAMPKVLVTSARAWLQPVLADIAQVEPVRLKVGDSYDFEALIERLAQLGYERAELVTGRGQFAVRGGLVDIFPPLEDQPLRLEFFGDEVDEIRYFSLSDQLTTGMATDGLWAGPVKELLLTPEVQKRAEAAIPAYPALAEMLEQVSQGAYVQGMEALAPLLNDSLTPFWDLLPGGTQLLLCDPEKIVSRCVDLVATTEEFLAAAWDNAAEGGKVPAQWRAATYATLDASRKAAEAAGFGWLAVPPFSGGGELAAGNDLEQMSADVDLGALDEETSASFAYFLDPGETTLNLHARDVNPYHGDLPGAIKDLKQLLSQDWTLLVTTQGAGSSQRLGEVFSEGSLPARVLKSSPAAFNDPVVYLLPGLVGPGFVLERARLAVMSEQDFTGRRGVATAQRKRPARRAKQQTLDPLALKAGDYIVHEQHGVGRFVEMVSRTTGRGANQVTRDYLVVEYASSKRGHPNDRLFVPTDSLDRVSKYSGGDAPTLNKMGGADWEKTKSKARKAVKEIAAELVRLYAARTASPGFAFSPDTPWQQELEDAFPYPETPDQLVTIAEVKADMEKPYPMDRLLCGDVGYGKTEVAVRAAFKAVQDGKQVAVLCPTTLLAQQHLETFTQRFMGFPVRVESLSRFSTPAQAQKVKDDLLTGKIDVVIGTHSLVTGQVRFKDLGLVIIDEEQRFGVEHKETLKQIRANVDVLAMSATPIPRTLEMAVTGIREMSMLQTPPEERHPVLTYVGRWQDKQMVAAIKRELMRDGQVFFVHNRVEDIDRLAAKIQDLVPQARVAVAHGKMNEHQLEKVIVDFWNREFDVLVCTTIVETGLDISNANTLIVDRADAMGLSQLHQLRGRVGRSRERAYAYFFYPENKVLTSTAHERLRTIATHSDLGAGMAVAMKDLEIRGAGNLLGGQQSGHIAGVGFDLYVRMVAEAVADFRGQKVESSRPEVKVELSVDAHIPPTYIPGEALRLETYAKIAAAKRPQELDSVREELLDRYGAIPKVVERLFALATLRQLLAEKGIAEVVTQGKYLRFSPVQLGAAQSARLQRLHPGSVQKAAVRQVLIPAPTTAKVGGKPVTDEALIEWIESVVVNILAWEG
ncbi:transcription-repair coupling factor [Boudabousia liubingyangii]|uniref:transcription-repair coupling factor n=1 Tax=Boudabousia liubingyangii TaxID=1921764 RepID=UPI00093C4921|nr:transcription-repair coupling factor [Boudabousia liubingyangii]OKL46342.1 transcription-repair coupling factor [Boudabousia liubingyangii]